VNEAGRVGVLQSRGAMNQIDLKEKDWKNGEPPGRRRKKRRRRRVVQESKTSEY